MKDWNAEAIGIREPAKPDDYPHYHCSNPSMVKYLQ